MKKLLAAFIALTMMLGAVGTSAFASEQCSCKPCKCHPCECAKK